MMNCPYCGSKNSDNAMFCSLCLKSFQSPAEIELALEVKLKHEEKEKNKFRFSPIRWLFLTTAILALFSVISLGVRMAKKPSSDILTSLVGISTSKKGMKIKKIIRGKAVEAYIGNLPENFPELLIYKNAKVKIGQKVMEEGGKISYLVIWETTDSGAKIIDFYNRALSEKGFEIIRPQAAGLEGIVPLSFAKGNMEGKISVSDKAEQTNINISVSVSP